MNITQNSLISVENIEKYIEFQYEKEISQITASKLPKIKCRFIDEGELEQINFKILTQLTNDCNNDEIYRENEEKAREIYMSMKAKNEENFKNDLTSVLNRQYETLERKISNNQFAKVSQLIKEINDFIKGKINSVYNQFKGKQLVRIRNWLINQFKSKLAFYALLYFEKEYEITFNKNTKEIKNLQTVIKNQNEKIDDNTIELAEIKNSFEKENESITENYEKKIKMLKGEIEDNENSKKKLENIYKGEINKLLKEKGLLEIEKDGLNAQIEEKSKMVQDIETESAIQIKEKLTALEKEKNDYETQITELKKKVETLTTQIIDSEGSAKTNEQLIEIEKIKVDELQIKLQHANQVYEKTIQELKNKFSNEKKTLGNQIDSKEKLIQKLLQRHQELEDENINNFKNLEGKIIQKAQQFENYYESEKQKNKFLEETNRDLTEQLDQMKKNQDKIIEFMKTQKNKNLNDVSLESKVAGIEEQLLKEKEAIESDLGKQKEKYIKENEKRIKSITFLENEIKNYELKLFTLQNDYDKLQNKNNELTKELNNLEKIRDNFNEELAKKNSMCKEEYEQALSKKEQEHQSYIFELNQHSEETLSQIKSLFDKEKRSYSERIEKLKTSNKSTIQSLTNEYEEKIKKNEKYLKSDFDNLQQVHEDLKAKYNTFMVESEHKIKILTQTVLTNQKIISENKQNLINLSKVYNDTIQEKIVKFDEERKELQSKIENILNEKNQVEKKLQELISQKEKLQIALNEKEAEKEKLKKENQTTVDSLIKKFELLKQKQIEATNDFTLRKLDFERESRLLKQQIDFLNKKLESQQQFSEEKEILNDENIDELQKKMEETFRNKVNDIVKEKEEVIATLQKKEKEVIKLKKKIEDLKKYYAQQLEEEKANSQKVAEKYQKQIRTLQTEIEHLNSEGEKPIVKLNSLLEKQNSLQKENSKLKESLRVLEKENQNNKKEIERLVVDNKSLITKNEDLNLNNNQLRNHLKVKNQNLEIIKRHNSLYGNPSLTVVNSTNLEQNNKMNDSQVNNVTLDECVTVGDSGNFNNNNNNPKKKFPCKKNINSLWKSSTEKKSLKK